MAFLRKVLRAAAGLLGGLLVGALLSLLLAHLKVHFQLPLPSLFWLIPVVITISTITGARFPGSFMWFFLCPLWWFLEAEESGDAVPADGVRTTWREFSTMAAYFFGLFIFTAGVVFSLPVAVGVGVLGITYFALRFPKHRQADQRTDSESAAAPGIEDRSGGA